MHGLKTNVMYIETSEVYGGSARCLLDILNHIDKNEFNPIAVYFIAGQGYCRLRKSQHEVVFLKTPYSYYDKYLAKKMSKYSINCLSLFSKIASIMLDKLPAIAMLYFFIKKRNIKLVHINIRPYYYPAVIAANLARIPCVSHVRGHGELTRVSRFFCKYIKVFISVSKSVRDELTSQGISPEKQVVIYDGIEIRSDFIENNRDDFKKKLNIKDEYVVGYVGRISENKGQWYFINAAQFIAKQIPNIRFLIVGDTASETQEDVQYLKKLKVLVKNLCMEDKIIFTGYREDVRKLFSLFDVFVLSSLQEGFGGVILEAMKSNVPIVATRSGGPSEILDDGVSGLLVPIKDPVSIANAVTRILNDARLKEILVNNAKKILIEKFDVRKNVRNIMNIYKTVL